MTDRPSLTMDNVVKITTVDVWDTLLRRRCHPDEVKLASAGYFSLKYGDSLGLKNNSQMFVFEQRRIAEVCIGNKRRETGFDDEYELSEVWKTTVEILAPHIADHTRLEIADEMVAYEIETEKDVIYPDNMIASTLSDFSDKGDIYLLSDFYMKEETLLEFVKLTHPSLEFKGAFSSCTALLNKRSGRLFKFFQNHMGVSTAQHNHIGDNDRSDVSVPQSQGINTKHFVNAIEETKRAELARLFSYRMEGNMQPYWSEIEKIITGLRSRRSVAHRDNAYSIGLSLSSTFVSYVFFCIEQAIRENVDKVYYFTREGEILAKIHNKILETIPSANLPSAEVLEVSRVATFGASLNSLSLSELNRLWTMYPKHSLNAFLKSLGVPFSKVKAVVDKLGFPLDELIEAPRKDPRFIALINEPSFNAAILDSLQEQRDLLKSYLAQKGIDDNTNRVLIVDIGWRGTIQDNLARVFPKIKWSGAYLGLFRTLNKQPDNVEKFGYLFDENRALDNFVEFAPQAPIEMLFNSPFGSVTGYEIIDGVVVARRLNIEGEDSVYHKFTGRMHEGILDATPYVSRYLRDHAILSSDMAPFVLNMLLGILRNPHPLVARSYFDLEHNEIFGNGIIVKQATKSGPLSLLQKGGIRSIITSVRNQAAESGWPSGYYAANNLLLARRAGRYARKARNSMRIIKSHALGLMRSLRNMQQPINNSTAGRRIRPLLDVISGVDLQDRANIDFNFINGQKRLIDDQPLVMSWIIPDVGFGSGGHMSIFRFVRYFQSIGVQCRIYVQGPCHHNSSDDLRRFIEHNYLALPGVAIYDSTSSVEECDILIATGWFTAYEVFKRHNTKFKCYFIQDFEPSFYARGSYSVFAENTYKMNLFGIAASPWLSKIVQGEYGMTSCFFNLGYDPEVYYQDSLVERDSNRVLVYLRPTTDRRGTELLLAALAQVKEDRPQTRIAIFGTNDVGYIDLPFQAMVLGLQNEEQLREQHSASAITLLTSLTNYSLIPIEAMACGSVVVDVDVESTQEVFGDDAPIVLAPCDPTGLARSIINVLDDPALRIRLSQEGIDYAKKFNWESAFIDVETAVSKAYFGDSLGPKLEDGVFRGEGGSRIYLIKSGFKQAIPDMGTLNSMGFDLTDVVEVPVKYLLRTPNLEGAT